MPDRLQELRRQRALVQEHLAWLDREIAEASGQPLTQPAPASMPAAPAVSLAPVARPLLPAVPPSPPVAPEMPVPALTPESPAAAAAPEVAAAADAILEEYRVAPEALKGDVKKGCFFYFFGALGLLALGVIALYYALK